MMRLHVITALIFLLNGVVIDPAQAMTGRRSTEPNPDNDSTPKVSLKEIVKDGLTRDFIKKYSGVTPETYERYEMQAFLFAKVHKRGVKPEEQAAFYASCISNPTDNPFCSSGEDIVAEEDVIPPETADDTADAEPVEIPPKDQLVRAIKKADLSVFERVPERDIHRALKKFSQWKQIEPLVEVAKQEAGCSYLDLLTALALKSEEYFPDEAHRALSISFYEKAFACGGKGSSFPAWETAGYRLSLLRIWAGQLAEARAPLEKLAEYPDGRYYTRSFYWRAYCAEKRGDQSEFGAMRSKLMQINLLGYHLLSLNQGKDAEVLSMVAAKDPVIRIRSARRPRLNPWIQAVEVLQSLGERDISRGMLKEILKNADGIEPDFRVYLAVLLDRAMKPIESFKMVSLAFQERPDLISEETLKIFYPLKNFDILKKHRTELDPYLAAALIRQESGFNPVARSPVGARGLMQLMPRTARRLARVSKNELFQPQINIRLGVKYFRMLLTRFKGDPELALAAYNAGPEAVDGWLRRYPTDNRLLFVDLIPFYETRNYVALIGRNYFWYLRLYAPESFGGLPDQAEAATLRKPAAVPSHPKLISFSAFSTSRETSNP